MIKLNFLTGALVSAGVLSLPGFAYAQDAKSGQASAAAAAASAPADGKTADAPTPASKAPDAVVPEDAAARAASRELDKIQTVTVTANKRLESSSKVAASLAAVSGDELKDKGVTSAADLTEAMPNVQIGTGSLNSTEIVIRGIGSSSNTELGDPEAAYHVNGIYLGRSQAASATFYDLDRVEVLRGPQGTLYGRNANAGAINVISKQPGPRLEGQVDVAFGNYNAQTLEGMINVPLASALAVRAVVSSEKHDGYTTAHILGSGATVKEDDEDSQSARISALLKFSPTASWLLIADGDKNGGHGAEGMPVLNGKPESMTDTPTLQPGRVHDHASGLTSELKVGLGSADLTYLYGHHQSHADEIESAVTTGVFYHLLSDYRQNSHELRLNSSAPGALQWVTGLYYYREVGRVDQPIYVAATADQLGLPAALDPVLAQPPSACGAQPACVSPEENIANPSIVESKAVFGQATYSLAPDWRATAGLRYNKDSRSRQGEVVSFGGLLGIPPEINSASSSGSKVTYKLGVEHDLNATQMVYATLATGYKGGGFNNGNQISPTTPGYVSELYYKPEEITSLEAGLKGRFLDGKLRLGASVFHYAYTDLQVASVVGAGASLEQLTTNAARASVTGAEFEGAAVVSENGRIEFGLGLLDSKYSKYITAGGTDYAGHHLDRAPAATLNLGYTYDWELADDSLISAYVGTRYTSSYTLTDPGSPTYGAIGFTQAGTTKSNVSLTYSGNNDRWKIQAFVKNIENKRSATALTSISSTQEYMNLSEPRTAGVRATYRF